MSLEWDWGICGKWWKWWKKKLKALKIMGIFKNQSNRTIQYLIRLNCIWRINGRTCQYNPITFVSKSADDFGTIIFYWAFDDTFGRKFAMCNAQWICQIILNTGHFHGPFQLAIPILQCVNNCKKHITLLSRVYCERELFQYFK